MQIQTKKKNIKEIVKTKANIRVRKNTKNNLLKAILFFNVSNMILSGLLLGTFWKEVMEWLQKIL